MKKLNIMTLLGAALANINMPSIIQVGGAKHHGFGYNPARPRKGGRNKSDLPHGYPGAKMARMAVMKRVGVRHLGLRLDGVTI